MTGTESRSADCIATELTGFPTDRYDVYGSCKKCLCANMSCMKFRIGTDMRRRLGLIFTVFEQLLEREVKDKQDIININMTVRVWLGNVGGHNFGPNFSPNTRLKGWLNRHQNLTCLEIILTSMLSMKTKIYWSIFITATICQNMPNLIFDLDCLISKAFYIIWWIC